MDTVSQQSCNKYKSVAEVTTTKKPPAVSASISQTLQYFLDKCPLKSHIFLGFFTACTDLTTLRNDSTMTPSYLRACILILIFKAGSSVSVVTQEELPMFSQHIIYVAPHISAKEYSFWIVCFSSCLFAYFSPFLHLLCI